MTPARPAQPDPGADEYDSILAAVMETARGRWFVAEFARRNRQVETEKVLDALSRIERRIAADAATGDADPDLIDLAAIFALEPHGRASASGLTGDVVADIARETGAAAESIRDHLLAARGALKGLSESDADARLCAAVDRAMQTIDGVAASQIGDSRKIEALAQIIGTIRDRVRRMLDGMGRKAPFDAASGSRATREADPWIVTPEAPHDLAGQAPAAAPEPIQPTATAQDFDEPILFEDDPTSPAPPFEGGLPLAPIGPGARLRLAIADEEQALRLLAASAIEHAPPKSDRKRLAELDRMTYVERHALFAS